MWYCYVNEEMARKSTLSSTSALVFRKVMKQTLDWGRAHARNITLIKIEQNISPSTRG